MRSFAGAGSDADAQPLRRPARSRLLGHRHGSWQGVTWTQGPALHLTRQASLYSTARLRVVVVTGVPAGQVSSMFGPKWSYSSGR